MSTHAALALVETVVDKHADDLLDLRRDLHAHPELSWHETPVPGWR
jgi:metal-dependent amidase/aminoacylase/carboxypeptidase family protein